MDWLEETYARSHDKCERADPEQLQLLAEGIANMNRVFGGGSTDLHEILDELLDPFLSNVKEEDKIYYLSAAKASGVEVEFGPAKWGEVNSGYVALYCHKKSLGYDLSNFWDRVRDFKTHAGHPDYSPPGP